MKDDTGTPERTDSTHTNSLDRNDGPPGDGPPLSRRGVLRTAAAGVAATTGFGAATDPASAGSDCILTFECKTGGWILLRGWAEKKKLTAKPTSNGGHGDRTDFLGHSVAIDGSTALVGAPWDEVPNPNGPESGAVYHFERTNGTWNRQGRLVPNDGDANDRFGSAVAFDGSTALVGAPGDDDKEKGAGSAYVFERHNGNWNQQKKFTGLYGDARFGESVAIDGKFAVVGAPEEKQDGAVYVFKRTNQWWGTTYWVRKTPSKKSTKDSRFGVSVDVESGTAIVGDSSYSDHHFTRRGLAYVFGKNNNWKLKPLEPKISFKSGGTSDSDDRFGRSVAIDGTTALVGAPRDEVPNPNGPESGAVYHFERTNGTWNRQGRIVPNDGDADDRFGRSVAIDGTTALVGAFLDDDPNGTNAGSAYVFERNGSGWTQQSKLVASDRDSHDQLGGSVALDGDAALLGARFDEDPNGTYSGSAYVFGYGWVIRELPICYADGYECYQVLLYHTEEFAPAERVAVESLRFGRPEAVDNGEGIEPGEARIVDVEGGEALVVTFPSEGLVLEGEEAVGKLVGETRQGRPLVATGTVRRGERDSEEDR